jgi:hypothetical protein
MQGTFAAACTDRGIHDVASVGVPIVNVSTTTGRNVLEDLLAAVRSTFTRENFKVIVIATSSLYTKSALLAANLTGILGPGYAVLLANAVAFQLAVPSVDPEFSELQNDVNGAIGLQP